MIATNLQQLKDHFLTLIENRFGRGSSQGHPDHQIFGLLNEAQRVAANHLQFTRTKAAYTLVASTGTLTLPDDVLAGRILVLHYEPIGGGIFPLTPVSYVSAYEMGTDEGTPTVWAVDETDPASVLIRPVPSEGGGQVKITYVAACAPLRRIYDSTVQTTTTVAGVTYGDATVAPLQGGTPFLPAYGMIQVGDAFGVITNTLTDGTAVTGYSPMRWYKIASIDGTAHTFELSEAFDEATNAAAGFIVAQVPDLEMAFPGQLGMALAEYAAGLYYSASAPDMSRMLLDKAIAQIGSIRDNHRGTNFGRVNDAAPHSGIYFG